MHRLRGIAAIRNATSLVRLPLAAFCLGLTAWGCAAYPLPPWPLAIALLAYAIALWRWPVIFLLVLPIVIPALDLGLWTGWMVVGESDFFVLTTLAVLLLRTPPHSADLKPSRAPRSVLLLLIAGYTISTVIGLTTSTTGHSDNPFLRPDNALRLAKAVVEALALLPFIRHRQRTHKDAVPWFARGMAAGLAVVTVQVLAERVLFASILDFSTAYRVAGPFSSMRVGGGHIGAYTALALPFTLCLFQLRQRWLGAGLATLACLGGGYTLAVTFARTGYAAGTIAMAVTGLGWLWIANRHHLRAVAGIVPVVLVLAALAAAAGFTGMYQRFADSESDLSMREQNWRAGLAVRDPGALTALFGMGLGSYQRTMLWHSPVNRPSDLVLDRDGQGTYASMRVESPFYLGQKIALPDAGPLHLTFRSRSPDGLTASVAICDKVLLYSDNCRGVDGGPAVPNQWTAVRATIPIDGLGGRAVFGLLRRPVELALFGPIGHRIEVRDIDLTDDAGRPMLVNGTFEHGLDRWIFTDDSHVSWRMLSQYLMLWFETGILGLAAFAGLSALALAGGMRALNRGAVTGAAVVGAIAGFLVSGLFDNVLEAPRLAALFFLVCWCGLLQWEAEG
jgi:O-antigen ligase